MARLIQASGPLAGASVIVTRPAASAGSLRRRIRGLGGVPIGLPGSVLRAAPERAAVCAALIAARAAAVAVFVSPAAVKFAFAACPKLRFARATRICAVGVATARALSRRGLRDVVWPRTRQDSEGLLALPELRSLRGCRAVLIGAPGGRELLAQTLRNRRARLTRIDVYHRQAPRYSARQLVALEQAPAPLLLLASSAEALANLRAGIPLHLFARLAAGDVVVSSERLAARARAGLFANVHVAAGPAPAELLNAACAVLARHRL
ncbi:MAG: uroporphyrinogen-III synthase [Xanthomonadaceae bacterium]|nr:uroporphyrinogen-III synthase [Xanthomonadaceae bacterium]